MFSPPSPKVESSSLAFLPSSLRNPDSECAKGLSPTPSLEKASGGWFSRPTQPNIILFLLDDQDESISPYFDAMPFARELFLQNGSHYRNAFTSTSICCPSRCQILTGVLAHNNGVMINQGVYGGVGAFTKPRDPEGKRLMDEEGRCINNENRSIGVFLQKYAGYRTGLFGKYLNGMENDTIHAITHIPPGWTEFIIGSDHRLYLGYTYILAKWRENNSMIDYEWHGAEENDYQTDVLRDYVLEFIGGSNRSQEKIQQEGSQRPLFAYVSPTAPHLPIMAAPRHKSMNKFWESQFEKYVASRASYYNEMDAKQKSRWLRESFDLRKKMKNIDWDKIEFIKRMGSLYAVDEMIKAIYDRLAETNQLQNTIFVLSSDNGYNLGSHGLIHKMSPYDESTRVPLYISGPGFSKGKVIDEHVLLIDLAPTFLELAGLQIPNYMDGVSLMKPVGRNALLLEYKVPGHPESYSADSVNEVPEWVWSICPEGYAVDIPPYKAVRTSDYLFVEYTERERDNVTLFKEHELYDLNQDPFQLNNLIADESMRSIVTELKATLDRLAKCNGKQCNNEE